MTKRQEAFEIKNHKELMNLGTKDHNFYIIGGRRVTKKVALEGFTLGITIYAKPKKSKVE